MPIYILFSKQRDKTSEFVIIASLLLYSFARVLHTRSCVRKPKNSPPQNASIDAADIVGFPLVCSHKVNSRLRDHKRSRRESAGSRRVCVSFCATRVLFLVSEYRRKRTSHRYREQNPRVITTRTPSTRLALPPGRFGIPAGRKRERVRDMGHTRDRLCV